MREGRRRRARARFAVGAAAFGVLTAGALGLTLLPGPGTDVTGVSTPAVGEAERERRAEYQRRMTALLDELLPDRVTDVRPVRDEVAEYRITAGGETLRMVVSVRPDDDSVLGYCKSRPRNAPACEEETQLRTGSFIDFPTVKSTVQYWYRKSRVEFTVYAGKAVLPVTGRDIFTVTQDPRFLELVKEADARPMELPEPPLGTPETAFGSGQRAR